jgi:hypothetical protein
MAFKANGCQSTTAATRLWTDTTHTAIMNGMVDLVSLVALVSLVKINVGNLNHTARLTHRIKRVIIYTTRSNENDTNNRHNHIDTQF